MNLKMYWGLDLKQKIIVKYYAILLQCYSKIKIELQSFS